MLSTTIATKTSITTSTTAIPSPTLQPFRFLDLPLEIREHIYRQVLPQNQRIDIWSLADPSSSSPFSYPDPGYARSWKQFAQSQCPPTSKAKNLQLREEYRLSAKEERPFGLDAYYGRYMYNAYVDGGGSDRPRRRSSSNRPSTGTALPAIQENIWYSSSEYVVLVLVLCRQVYDEARRVLYSGNTFMIRVGREEEGGGDDVVRALKTVMERNFLPVARSESHKFIRKVILWVTPNHTHYNVWKHYLTGDYQGCAMCCLSAYRWAGEILPHVAVLGIIMPAARPKALIRGDPNDGTEMVPGWRWAACLKEFLKAVDQMVTKKDGTATRIVVDVNDDEETIELFKKELGEERCRFAILPVGGKIFKSRLPEDADDCILFDVGV